MWNIGYNPPAGAYGIEIWVLPQDNGIAGGSGGWIFSSGQSGGVALRINAPGGGNPSYIDATTLGGGIGTFGAQAPIDTNRWMHLAIVDDGTYLTFYTNGIPCGDPIPSAGNSTTPAGAAYIGTPDDTQAYYGYLDEARMFTFAAGAFTTNDFLLRPAGPQIVTQPPANVYAWNGGAVPISVIASLDFTMQYQWRRGGVIQGGATTSTYFLPTVAPGDTASTFDCILTSGSQSVTSSVATLQVVAINPDNVAAYQHAIQTNAALVAYFPVDGNTGTTLSNTKDGTHNGTLQLGATYDGRTNTSFGQRALSFNINGDVTIANNSAYEFSSGFGTVEALVYMSQTTSADPTIFAEDYDDGVNYFYAFRASADGGSLTYNNFSDPQLSWAVPGGLIGKLSHVAFVFDNLTNVTAYVNGQNLGTKTQTSFNYAAGGASWIGAMGNLQTGNRWAGTIDELAVYSSALSQDTIQGHYSDFVFGTNTSSPTIVSAPASRTVLSGASPILVVQAGGTLPLRYSWTSNTVTIAGATTPSLATSNITATTTYAIKVQNAYGSTNRSIVLTPAAPPAGYAATVMTDHPSSFWRLSDSSGQPALDSAGFNDGVYNGSGVANGVASIPGESGTAVTFDGSAGRAIAPYSTSLNPSGPLTVEFWAKLNTYGFWVPVSSMNRPARDGGYEYYLDGNSAGYEWHSAPGGYAVLTASSTAPTVGTWYHVAGVSDGTTFYLYINGEQAELFLDNAYTEEGSAGPLPNLSAGFYIGSRSDSTHYFNGTMADVAFYNYALTQQQIRKHTFAGMPSPFQLTSIGRQTNVVVDSKPAGSPHGGINGPWGTNAATWVASSPPRTGVMQFDGTVGNQITLAANPDFDSLQGTIMFWMKSAGTVGPGTAGAALFDRRYSFPGFGNFGDVIVQQDGGAIAVAPWYWGATVLAASPLSGGSVNDGAWHHVAYVYDQTTTGSATLFVDGAQVGTGAYNASYAWAWPGAQEIELGQSHDTSLEQYNGQMDDFRIYNRMLTGSEISSVYSSDAVVDSSTLMVRFNFDAAPGGLAVTYTPGAAVPQSATAVKGPYVSQPTGRSPVLVPVPASGNEFFRGVSP